MKYEELVVHAGCIFHHMLRCAAEDKRVRRWQLGLPDMPTAEQLQHECKMKTY